METIIIAGDSRGLGPMRVANTLVNELIATLRDIAVEAGGGDLGARDWLLAAFPAHRRFLIDSWAGGYSSPPTAKNKGQTMSFNSDGQFIGNGPTPAELAQSLRENTTARQKFDAERAAVAAEKAAAHEAEAEAEFKTETRLKYASLSDADFARLWSRIRDDELLARARLLAETPRASDLMYSQF